MFSDQRALLEVSKSKLACFAQRVFKTVTKRF